jgi:hypothetical protein
MLIGPDGHKGFSFFDEEHVPKLQLRKQVSAFLSATPFVFKYMTPLTFYFKFDHQYILNKLVN